MDACLPAPSDNKGQMKMVIIVTYVREKYAYVWNKKIKKFSGVCFVFFEKFCNKKEIFKKEKTETHSHESDGIYTQTLLLLLLMT